MLRALRLNNFVKIHDDCVFSFPQDGAYFFVGQNGSGKSSIFEAIRRCLSLESNTSFSRMPDESKPTYIICEYEIPAKDRSSFDCKKVFTTFLHIPDAASNYKYVRIVLLVDDDMPENGKVLIELIERKNTSHDMKHCTCSFQSEKEKSLRNEILKKLPHCTKDIDGSEDRINILLKVVQELLEVKKEDPEMGKRVCEITETIEKTETFLITLENRVVFTFGLRSVGTLQWSKSKLITKDNRENNYKSARDKCEIIKYFLSKENSGKYDHQKEDKIFGILTDGTNYSFEIENEEVNVKLDGRFVEVLKMSEGILEAKYLSLLLASNEFFTVFLEEPDRGMHPQMIWMIRDIVLPLVKEKTMIIVTHNPTLIASWSIPRIYKFYKEQSGNDWISRMVPVGRVAEKGKNKIPRLLASEDYVSMIFARKVIFVEGQSDFLFFRALVAHILNPSKDDSTQRVLKLALSEEKSKTQQRSSSEMATQTISREYSDDILPKVRTFLASLHVVKLSGEKSKNKWHYLSKELGLSRLFLLDRNAVVKVRVVDTCTQAAEIVKNDIERLVTEAVKSKQGKLKRQSQNTHESPKVEQLKTEAMKSDFQQPITEAVEPEQGKQKRKSQDKQDNPDVARLKTAVTEAMTYKFWNQTDTVYEGNRDEHMERLSIQDATEKMKDVIKKIVSRSDSWDNIKDILNEEDKKVYHQYFRATYEDLLCNISDKIPISTILHELPEKHCIVSQDQQRLFSDFVKKNKWEEARKCLETEGVFVWRSGNLEDAFIDLVINFECDDERRRHTELLRRHTSFIRLGINLNLTKVSTKQPTKLYMDDKVSDEHISESIVAAFNLCGKNSDITQFIRFLVFAWSD